MQILCAATFKKYNNVLALSAIVIYFWNKIHLFSNLLYLEVIFLRIWTELALNMKYICFFVTEEYTMDNLTLPRKII